MVFTYHHSRDEGWQSLAEATQGAGFTIINSHPVKAEMSVATPKSQAKDPIQLDIILVCRKAACGVSPGTVSVEDSLDRANAKVRRLADAGFLLSRNDRKIVFFGQLLTTIADPTELARLADQINVRIDRPLEVRARREVEVQQSFLF